MRNFAALAVLTLLGAVGCTRGSNKTGTVALKFKTAESLTLGTSSLAHVVINVTGPGVERPVFIQWDRHDFVAM